MLTNLDVISVKRNPSSFNELANKNYVDNSLGEGTFLKNKQTLQNYLKVSVGDDVYIPKNYNKHEIDLWVFNTQKSSI